MCCHEQFVIYEPLCIYRFVVDSWKETLVGTPFAGSNQVKRFIWERKGRGRMTTQIDIAQAGGLQVSRTDAECGW